MCFDGMVNLRSKILKSCIRMQIGKNPLQIFFLKFGHGR